MKMVALANKVNMVVCNGNLRQDQTKQTYYIVSTHVLIKSTKELIKKNGK